MTVCCFRISPFRVCDWPRAIAYFRFYMSRSLFSIFLLTGCIVFPTAVDFRVRKVCFGPINLPNGWVLRLLRRLRAISHVMQIFCTTVPRKIVFRGQNFCSGRPKALHKAFLCTLFFLRRSLCLAMTSTCMAHCKSQ